MSVSTSPKTLDARRLPADQGFSVPNTPAGHRQLLDSLQVLAPKFSDVRVVLESTGGLELPVALALEEAGAQVAIIKPERARYFAKAHGQLAKTDAIDAAILARFARDVDVPIVPLPPKELRHFRDLLDRRQQLVDMRTMESNRLGSTTLKAARERPRRRCATNGLAGWRVIADARGPRSTPRTRDGERAGFPFALWSPEPLHFWK